jgi:hypothetical protein
MAESRRAPANPEELTSQSIVASIVRKDTAEVLVGRKV